MHRLRGMNLPWRLERRRRARILVLNRTRCVDWIASRVNDAAEQFPDQQASTDGAGRACGVPLDVPGRTKNSRTCRHCRLPV